MISLTEEASRERPDFPVLTHQRTHMDPPEKPDDPPEEDATPLEKDDDPDNYILPGCPD